MIKKLLDLDVEQQLQLSVDDFIGRSVAVLGITGSGKTNTAAVLIEELLSSGLPLTIADIEGEYWGLRERFQLLIAGRSEHAELPLEPGNAAALAELSLLRGISVILDLSEYTQDESQAILFAYVTRLWEIASLVRKPYQLVLEEAHEWILQGARTPLKGILTRLALRGRKRGLGIIMLSQRSAKVEKDVLTQASLLFLHKVIHPVDMRVYADLIPLPAARVEKMVQALQPGQVVVVYGDEPRIVQIRMRSTFHAGSTPTFGEGVHPELCQVDETLLRELQQLLAVPASHGSEEDVLHQAEKRIKELEQLLAVQDADVARLTEQNALLSRLSVSMDGTTFAFPEQLRIGQTTIEQATVHQLYGVQTPLVVEAASLHQASLPPPAVVPINKAKVQSLQTRISQLPGTQLRIFKVLVEHDVPMTLDEIAAWMNVSKSTVQRNIPPDALFKMGLIRRSQSGNAYVYRSLLKEYLIKQFPEADQGGLLRQLLSSERNG